MLSKRRRKPGGTYYVRGTVRVGDEVRAVQEHASGCRAAALADAYVQRLEARLQREILYGAAGRARDVTFAEIGQRYIERPEGLHRNDVWRVGQLNEVLGDVAVADIADGWARFTRLRCAGLAPATVGRFRDTLQAALNAAAEELGYAAPRIKPVGRRERIIAWLTVADAERLTRAYVPHVRPIVLVYRYQGCRAQEALQLLWPAVDFGRATVFYERTKNSEPRTVGLHERVYDALLDMWEARGRPARGHVFLNRLGRPYADTRDYRLPGGNPLRAAHCTALARAADAGGITVNGNTDRFTIHCWRHHWASWSVVNGIDLETIRRQGGWKSLRMVERYMAVSDAHVVDASARLKQA